MVRQMQNPQHDDSFTVNGQPVTDEQIQAWSDEAEAGYDPAQLKRRGRPRMGSEAAAVATLRLDPELEAAIMAPPASSGSSPLLLPSLKAFSYGPGRNRRARTPAADDDVSDISSPPSLTHSPNYRAPATRRKVNAKSSAARDKPVATADLSAFMPQRRKRAPENDPWNLDSDGVPEDADDLSEDDDELSRAKAHRRTRKGAHPLAASATTATQSHGKKAQKVRQTKKSRQTLDID